MASSWIALHPQWYVLERERLSRHYPEFRVDEGRLSAGELVLYGELLVRPSSGTRRYPVQLRYPPGTPFEVPQVTPLQKLPESTDDGAVKAPVRAAMHDHRHQMPTGTLCLFQRETRATPGGDLVRGIDALRRAEQWFLGLHTGHWPPDSAESELEMHFAYATDILMGQAFFQSRLEGCGQFFLIPDLRRIHDSNRKLDEVYPYIATALTRESGIVEVVDSRSDLSRLYPWIASDAWDSYRIAQEGADSLYKARQQMGLERGYWWSLPKEPRPFHDGAGLLRELAKATADNNAWPLLRESLKGELSTAAKHFIGLRYPGRDGSPAWLVVLVLRDQRSGAVMIQSDADKRASFERSQVFCLHAHAARPSDLNLRNTGVVSRSVAEKTVALIGLGALGSRVAELLAQAGVGNFRLCDGDRLATGNVARHVGGLTEFGAPKVQVVITRLLEINPYLKFEKQDIIAGSAVSSLDRLSVFLQGADLTISTTADESVESVINQIAVLHRRTVLYGRSLKRGSFGRVFLVRPGQDACKMCLASYAQTGRAGIETPAGWIDVPEGEDEALLHECGRPVIPASAADLAFTASLIARVALDILEGRQGPENHWLWHRFAETEIDSRLEREWSTFSARLPQAYNCHVCQEPDVVEVILPESVRAEIIALTEASPESETGGVLIGYVDKERRAVVVKATEPGPKSIQTRYRFERDVEYVQQALDQAGKELGNQGLYIGEWHSHLEVEPEPSPTDITSLCGISEAPH